MEELEPRVMLSADLAALGVAGLQHHQPAAEVVHVMVQPAAQAAPVSDLFAGLAPAVTATQPMGPAQTPAPAQQETAQVQQTAAVKTTPTATAVVTPAAVQQAMTADTTTKGTTQVSQLTETLKAPNGPPSAQISGQDLVSYIGTLIGGTQSVSVNYTGSISVGGVLQLNGVTLGGTLTYDSTAKTFTGTVTIAATSVSLFPGSSYSASITAPSGSAISGTYTLTSSTPGAVALSMASNATLTMTVGEALKLTATGVNFTYSPSGAGNQTIATVASASVTSSQFTGFNSATLTSLVIRQDGFGWGTLGLTAAGPIAIGNFLSADSTSTLSASNFNVSFGYGSNAASVSGTIGLTLNNLDLFQGGGVVTLKSSKVVATYTFAAGDATTATGALAVTISNLELDIGSAFKLTTTGDTTITPDQTTIATIASANLTVVLEPNLQPIALTGLTLTQTGFSIANFTVSTVSQISLGSFLTLSSPDGVAPSLAISVSNFAITAWAANPFSGTIAITSASAALFSGSSFSASITADPNAAQGTPAITGSYTLTGAGGTFSLTAAELTLTVGNAVGVNAAGATLTYDPNGGASQTLATISNATANSTLFSGFQNANLTSFVLRTDGFSFNNFTLSTPDGTGISLAGGAIAASSATITVAGSGSTPFNVTYGGTPAVSGTVTLSLPNGLNLYPGGFITLKDDAVSGTFSFAGFDGTHPSAALTINIDGLELDIGGALKLITQGTVSITASNDPSQPNLVTIPSAVLSSPQFPTFGSVTVQNVLLTKTGFSLGSATWSSGGPVSFGGAVSATGVTLSLNSLALNFVNGQTSTSLAMTGTLTISATGVTLFPSVPLINLNLGTLTGSYNLGDPIHPALDITIPDLTLHLGDAFTLALGSVTLHPGSATVLSVTGATATENLFSGLGPINVSSFTMGPNGFTVSGLDFKTSSAVTVGSFLSMSSLEIYVSNFSIDTTASNPITASIVFTFGKLSLFPGSDIISSSFSGLTGSYDFSNHAGQFSFGATDFTLAVGPSANPLVSIEGQGITLTPDDATLLTIDSAKVTVNPLNGLVMTVTGLAVQQTGFSIASASATFSSGLTLGSIFALQDPTVTLTNIVYNFGGVLTGTVGFSAAGVTLNLGSALTASTGTITASYDLDSGVFSGTLANFNLTLAGFATVGADSISVAYTPATDGSATFLIGATGVTAFVGVGSGANEVGALVQNGSLALGIFKASTANGGAITYALDASGSASLVGLPAGTLSVSAGSLDVRSNTAGAVNTSINVGGTALPLVFTANVQSAYAANLSISVGSFISVTGDFAVSQFTSNSQTYVAIAAQNVNASLTVAGVGASIQGASLALLIQSGGGAAGSNYALVAGGGTDAFTGVPDLTLTVTGLSVLARHGLDPSTVTGIPTVVTPDGTSTLDFSALGTGTGDLTQLLGSVTLSIANFVSVQGSFGFQGISANGSTFLSFGASGLNIVLGTATTNLTISGANLGVIVEPGTNGAATGYALEATASSVALNGVPNLTLSASNILLLARNGLDVTAAGVPNSVVTSGGTVTLSGFSAGTSPMAVVQGHMTLAVTGFGSIQGDFGFQTFIDSQTFSQELAIGATNTTVTLGTATTNLTVSGASLGLVIRPGATADATTYALEATASSAAINGMGDLGLSASNIIVRIRNGLSLGTEGGIPTSVATSNGAAPLNFSGLPSGAANLIDVEATVNLTIGSFVSVSGNFGFQSYSIGGANYVEAGGTGVSVTLGAGGVNLTLANATLALVDKEGAGYAVEVIGSSVAADTALTGITGLTLNATNLQVLARSGLDASTLPATLPASVHTSGGDVSLAFAGLGSGSAALDEIAGNLTLNIDGFVSLTGAFGFEKFTDGAGSSDILVAANNVNATLGTSTFNVTVAGASLSLLIVPGTGYAIDASGGTDSLNGISELSLSASGLTVLSENGVDPSAVKNLPTSIQVPGASSGVAVSFADLAANHITLGTTEIYGNVAINIAGFATLSGDFSFSQSKTTTAGVTVNKILIGGTNITAFVGSPDGTFGVQLTGASFGLAMYHSSATGNSYALSATTSGISLLGLPSDIVLTGNATVSINTTGGAVNETLPGGQTIAFTDGTNNTANQSSIRSFGGSLTLTVAGYGLTGNFSVASTTSNGTNELLVGASGVASVTPVGGATGSSDTFNLTNGTLGLVIFGNGGGYAMTASATAAVAVGSALSGSATLTIRRNTTATEQDVSVTVGTTVIPVEFASNEDSVSNPPAFQQVILSNTSISLGDSILVKAGGATQTTPVTGATSTPLTQVSVELTDGTANPGASDILLTISASSATYTSFSGTVTSAAATGVGIAAPQNGSWNAGDSDLLLTHVTFSIGGIVTFTAASIDLQHYTSGTATISSFAFTGAVISFYSGSQQLLSLGGSPTFQYSSTSGFSLTSFTNPSFSFLGLSLGGSSSSSTSGGLHSDALSSNPNAPQPAVTLGPLTLSNPSVSIGNFGFKFGSGGATLSATVTLTLGTATLHAGGALNATFTNLSGSFDVGATFNLANLTALPTITANGFTLKASSMSATISLGGVALTLSATGTTADPLQLNPSATAGLDLISFGSLTASLTIPGAFTMSGSATNFAIEGDGSFLAKDGFSVTLSLGTNPDGSMNTTGTGLPAWLPITQFSATVRWTDFNTDPTHFTLEVTAEVSTAAFEGTALTITGGITDMVIDPSLAAQGQFPITALGGFNVGVSGILFGMTVKGTLIGGIISFDANGNTVDPTGYLTSGPNTGTKATGTITSVFYAGIEGGINFAGEAGVDIKIGLSDYGPLDIYIDAQVPIPLGPTGLFISNLRGGIDFGTTFPTLNITGNASDALQLNGPFFTAPENQTAAQWQAQLASTVVTQYENALKNNNGQAPSPAQAWANFITQPPQVVIQAGVSIYAGSEDAFIVNGDLFLDTKGDFLVLGSATIGAEMTVGLKMYAQMSTLFTATSNGEISASFLFLMQFPAQNAITNPVPLYSVYGEVSFSNQNGFTITVAGGVNFNLENGLEAQVQGTLTLNFSGSQITLSLSNASFTVPQIQQAPLGTAAGEIIINIAGTSTSLWGGFLLTPNLTGLQAMGINAGGQVFIKLNTSSDNHSVTLNLGTSQNPAPITLTLNPHSFELYVNGYADFSVAGQQVFRLNGTLDFAIANGTMTIFVNATLAMGPNPSSPILNFNATGLIYVQLVGDNPGFAAKMTLSLGATNIPNVTFGLNWLLVINTTGANVTYDIPAPVATTGTIPSPQGVPTVLGPDYSSSNPAATVSYETVVGGVRELIIPGGAPSPGLSNYANWDYNPASAGPYFIFLGRGTLSVAGSFVLTGSINIIAANGVFDLSANASLSIIENGSTVFTFQAQGGIEFIDGGVAAALQITMPNGVPSSLGFSLNNASFLLELNTTGKQETIGTITVSAGSNDLFAEVQITGDLEFLGGVLDLNGTFTLTATGSSLTIAITSHINFLGATFNANGSASIYYDNHPGLALYIQLSFAGGGSAISPASGIAISGTFTLAINTTALPRLQNGVTVNPGFAVSVSNVNVWLWGFNATGSLAISVTSGGFSFSANLNLNFLNIVTIGISGSFDTSGHFSFTGSVGFSWGDSWGGLDLHITVSISNSGFSASLSGDVHALGVSVGASASLSISTDPVDVQISVSIDVVLVPAFTIYIPGWWIFPSTTINVPAVEVSGSHTFDFGETSAEPSVAGIVAPPAPPTPPKLATDAGGVLTLNLGTQAGNRTNGNGVVTPAQANENYTLSLISAGPSGDTIQITALGYTEQYTGVTSIVIPDTSTSNTTVAIDNAINLPVTASLNSGNNTISTGSGLATVTSFGSGTDSITTGNGGYITLSGSGTNTVSTGSSSTVVVSGGGNNNITTYGAGAAPITISGNGNNTLHVNNGGSETITISGGGTNTVTVSGGSPTLNVTSAATGGNQLSVTSSANNTESLQGSGANHLTVSGSGGSTITVGGSGSPTIVTGAGAAGITLQGSGHSTLTTGAGFATIHDQGSGQATIAGGSGGGTYVGGVISGNSAFSSKANSSLTAGAGAFTVSMSGYANYTLSNSTLTYGSYSLALSGISQVTLNAISVSSFGSNPTFALTGYTGSATLHGSGSFNSLSTAPASGVASLSYVLSNSTLGVTGGVTQTITLTDLQNATLTGAQSGNNSFDVSTWTGGGSLVGPAGAHNTLVATDNGITFTLSNTSFARTGGYGTLTLTGIQAANLFGGNSSDTFNVGTTGAWTGTASLQGKGTNDIYNVTLAATGVETVNIQEFGGAANNTANVTGPLNVLLTNSAVKEGSQTVNYSGIGTLNVTGTAPGLTYDVQSTGVHLTTVNADGGSSTVLVGSTAGQTSPAPGLLTGILGALSVSNANQLTLDNTGSTANVTGTLTDTNIGGFGMGSGGINYSAVGLLTLNLGSGISSITMTSASVATHTIIHAGSAVDDAINATVTGDFNGELDLTGFEHGSVTVNGNFNGTLNSSAPGLLDAITIKGGMGSAGRINVGGIGTMTVTQSLAGNVVVTGTLGNLIVGGAVSGNVSETGTIATVTIGSLTGALTANHASDPAQYSSASIGDIGTMKINGSDSGTLTVSGNVGTLLVTGSVSGTIAVQGALTSLTINGDLAQGGKVTESGPVSLVSILGNLASGASYTAANATAATASLASFNVGQTLAGLVTISGSVTRMTVGSQASNFLSGTVTVGQALANLAVTGDLSGTVSETGTIVTLTVSGNLAASGTITAANAADPVQLPTSPAGGAVAVPASTLGNIQLMTVGGNLAGTVTVSGNVGSLAVGTSSLVSSLSGQVTVQGTFNLLSITGDLSGTVKESGTMTTVTIGGALSGTLDATNTNDSYYGHTEVADGNVGTLNVGGSLSGTVLVSGGLTTVTVGGSVSGTVTETGTINLFTITGGITATGVVNAQNWSDPAQVPSTPAPATYGNIVTFQIGSDLAGQVNVSGAVTALTVGGSLSGTVSVQGTLASLQVTGDVSGKVTESGTVTTLAVTGSVTGTVNAVNTNDPYSGHTEINDGNIVTFTVGGSLSGTVLVSGTLTTLTVTGSVSGTVTETGTVNLFTIGGALTSTGVINAQNWSDPAQVPSTPAPSTYGNIVTFQIGADLAGQVNVSGAVTTLTVGGNLSGAVAVQGTLTTLKVTGDLSGKVTESGTVATLAVTGSVTGTVNAVNTNDPYSGHTEINDGNIVTFTVGGNVSGTVLVSGTLTTLTVGGNVSGTVTETGTVNLFTIGGALTSTGVVNAQNWSDPGQVPGTPVPATFGNIVTFQIGTDLAGKVNVSGAVTNLTVGGSLSGTAAVQGTLTTLGVTGDLSGQVLESGVINSLTIGGSLTGLVQAKDTDDSTQLPASGQTALASINTMSVGQNLTGTLTVTGNLGTLTVGTAASAPENILSGTVAVQGTLSHLTVAGDVTTTGKVTESGTVQTLAITGFFAGTITAQNNLDPAQLPTSGATNQAIPATTYANVGAMTVTGTFSGTLTVSGSVTSLAVGTATQVSSLSGKAIIQGTLGSLTITGDLSGIVSESGTIATLTVNGSVTGAVSAINSNDPYYVHSEVNDGNIVTFTVGGSLSGTVLVSGTLTTLTVGGSVSGTVTETGTVNLLAISGALTSTGVINAQNWSDPAQVPSTPVPATFGNIVTFQIGSDLAGQVNVTGAVATLTVGGKLSGTVTVQGTLTTLAVTGDVSGKVYESGMINALTIGGSLTGLVQAKDTNDSTQVPATNQIALASINTMSVGQNLTGTLTVTGNVGTLTIGTATSAPENVLSGTVSVQGTLSHLTVTGDVTTTGNVTESGTVQTLAITGFFAGTITAQNHLDPTQLPTDGATTQAVPALTYANIGTMTVNGNFSGTLTATGSVNSLAVGTATQVSSLSGKAIVQGTLTTLAVTGDVSGTVAESGTINTLTIGGSLTASGVISAINSNDPYYVHTQTHDGNIVTFTIGGNLAGTVLVSSTLTTLSVGGDFSGKVTETGLVNAITVGGQLSGQLIAVNWSDPAQLPASGAVNQPVPTITYANIATLQVNGNLSGTVTVSGSVTHLTVGVGAFAATPGTVGAVTEASSLSGTVTVQGTIANLLITFDLSGRVSESGNLANIAIDHTLSGALRADNSNDVYYVKGSTTDYGDIGTLVIGQDFSGSIFVSGHLNNFTIVNGQMTRTATLTLGGSLGSMVIGPNALSVGQNMAGLITIGGNLGTLQVAGGTPGVIVVGGKITEISVYGGFGPIVLNVTENGIQRLIDATPLSNEYPAPYVPSADPYAVPTTKNYINYQFTYEGQSLGLANAQATIRVTNFTGSTAQGQADLSLITYNDTAKFNLARLDANGVSGLGNVVVEGDLLTAVTTRALSFFTPGSLTSTGPSAGILLPNDALIGVAIRDFAPNGEIEAKSIEGVAFGSYLENGRYLQTGFQADADDATALLASSTMIVQANGTFRVAFADLFTQQVAFFFDSQPNNPNPGRAPGNHFDNSPILFAVESQIAANAAGTANIITPSNVARGAATALINVLPTYDPNGSIDPAVVQTIAINGDGAAIATSQWIELGITSTGALGDLFMGSPLGLTDVTAPSIFGSIVDNGSIIGTVQTTGLRTDPITGAVTTVSSDIGSLFVLTTKNPPWSYSPVSPFYPNAAQPGFPGLPGLFNLIFLLTGNVTQPYVVSTVIYGHGGPDGGIAGSIIDRGNLYSAVEADGGMTGLLAVQGNMGATHASNYGTLRFGGLVIHGQLNGTVVVLGQEIGDVTIDGGLKGGDYLVEGAVVGNLTINGGLDAPSSIVFGSSVGSTATGTTFTENGDNKGIIAALGAINFAKGNVKGAIFSNLGTSTANANAAAVLSIFTRGGTPLGFDLSPQDLAGLHLILLGLDNLSLTSSGGLTTSTASTASSSSVTGNFSNTAIAAGNTIWFSSSVQVNGWDNAPGVQLYFTGSTITFTAPGSSTPVTIAVPNAEIVFAPYTTTAVSTVFNAATNTWVTTVPEGFTGNIFLTGVAYKVAANIPGNVRNVTWTGTFTSNTVGLGVNWSWGAAVYKNFGTDYNSLGIQATDTNLTLFGIFTLGNSAPAGSPINDLAGLVSGAGGNGGHDFTGSEGSKGGLNPPDTLIHP